MGAVGGTSGSVEAHAGAGAHAGYRQHGRGTAAVPVGAERTCRVERKVSAEAEAGIRRDDLASMNDQPVAHPRSDRDDREVVDAAGVAEPLLGGSEGDDVVLHRRGQIEALFDGSTQIDVVPVEKGSSNDER